MGMDFTKARISASVITIAIAATGSSTVFAAASYPVQEFRFGIADTDRNIAISGTSAGDYLTSNTMQGTANEKWSLNYISAGVYEIVNSATGMIVTNENGLATIAKDVDGTNQRWKIEAVEKDFEGYDLYYKVVSNADNKVAITFDIQSNSFTVDTYTGDNYQKFKLNLDGLEGFAANALVGSKEKAGTIGGLLGEVVYVSTADDLEKQLNSKGAQTIVITADIDMQKKSNTRVRDYKTIVGQYGNHTIYDSQFRTNDAWGTAGEVPSDNIVFRNLKMVAKNIPNRILINVWSSRQIWIDHIHFESQLNYDRSGNGQDEVGKFIWINTPYANYRDSLDRYRSPDYVTISYCHLKNRYWTVAYGTQNDEITRDRTTLLYNWWDKNVRRCPQLGNGSAHIYNNYYSAYGKSSNGPATTGIIGGDGSDMVSTANRFNGYTSNQALSMGGGTDPARDEYSYLSETLDGTPSKVSFSPKKNSTWKPEQSSYGYSLIDAYNTKGTDVKDFCTKYACDQSSATSMKDITDSDFKDWVTVQHASPFLKSIEVGNAPVGKEPIVIETPEGSLVKDLTIIDRANYSGWGISTAKTDGKVFGDRDVTFSVIPDALANAEQVVTACNSKNSTTDAATFTATKDIVVYIGLDSRVEKVPGWLSTAEKTEMKAVASNDVTFEIYKIKVDSGATFTLGSNGQSSGCVNYIAFVQEANLPSNSNETGEEIDSNTDPESGEIQFAGEFIEPANLVSVGFVGGTLFVNNGSGNAVRATLFDLNGSIIANRTLASGSHSLETKGLAHGTYLVRIHGKGLQKTVRILF